MGKRSFASPFFVGRTTPKALMDIDVLLVQREGMVYFVWDDFEDDKLIASDTEHTSHGV